MNTTIIKAQPTTEIQMNFFTNMQHGKILVDIEGICNYYGKPYTQICQDEDAINDILDHYTEMVGMFDYRAPF